MSRYFKGHRPRHGSARPAHFMPRIGASAVPDKVDLWSGYPIVLDQGQTSSCTGHAHSGALAITCRALGLELPWIPSQKDLYAIARAIERGPFADPKTSPLTDNGADPADVLTAFGEWGIRAMRPITDDERSRVSDCSPDTVNGEPRFDDLEADSLMLFGGAREIVDTSPGAAVRASLAAGSSVTIAFCALDIDESAGLGAILDASPQRGPSNHNVSIVGHEKQPNNSYLYWLLNSWGKGWGTGGRALVTEGFLNQTDCRYSLQVRRIAK